MTCKDPVTPSDWASARASALVAGPCIPVGTHSARGETPYWFVTCYTEPPCTELSVRRSLTTSARVSGEKRQYEHSGDVYLKLRCPMLSPSNSTLIMRHGFSRVEQ